jgi:excinuclease ABC subunit A
MIKMTEDQIVEVILEKYSGQKAVILSPIIKGRKGHYRELFVEIAKKGFNKVRVNGELQEIEPKMQLDRFKTHDIEIVIDRLVVREDDCYRITQSCKSALQQGNGIMMLLLPDRKNKEGAVQVQHFSKFLMCPTSGISYSEPAPNMFSFNSPYGACPSCKGLGEIEEITVETIIPDKSLSISRGAIAPLGEYRDIWIFKKIEAILKHYKHSLSTPLNKISDEIIHEILYGSDVNIEVASVKNPGSAWSTEYELIS